MNYFKGLFASRLKKVFFLVAVFVVALAAGVYAYWMSLPPAEGPRVTITSPPLEFSLELDKTEYQYGENITIRLCLKNVSNETIKVTKRNLWPIYPDLFDIPTEAEGATPEPVVSGNCHFGFSITNQNGTEIFKEYEGHIPATYDFYIEPNGYIKQTWIWYNLWEGSPVIQTLPKGTYQIRGIFGGAMVESSTLDRSIMLETPTITFTIK